MSTAYAEQVSEVWSRDPEERAEIQGWYWMAHPLVAQRVNHLISGDAHCDAYGRLKLLYQERGWPLPIRHAASLGCGFGNLERALKAVDLVAEIDAYDVAEGAIAEARRLAHAAGLTGVSYHVADLDSLDLAPDSLDAVFAHSAVHHVERLEALYATVRRGLRPGGVLHLHEFVGPSRFQWTDAQLALVNEYMDLLPPRLRRLPSGEPKGRMTRPTVEQMIAADPSEAIRSAELVTTLEPFFEIIEERRTGGALLHLALGDIAQNFDPNSAEDCAILRLGFAMEDKAMADGAIGSDFAIITAMPRMPLPAVEVRTRHSFAMRAARVFPPARRFSDAMRSVAGAIDTLSAQQAGLQQANALLRAEQGRLAARIDALAVPVSLPATAPVRDDEELDRWTGRELQSAAARCLPFLPGNIVLEPGGIRVEGYAGAQDGLHREMAFFINGHRIDCVEYPVTDQELASRFPEVAGMGVTVKALMTARLETLHRERFWRLDASSTGHYRPHYWRQAIHFMNPLFETFPLPPESNIKRVIGDTSQNRFAMGGAVLLKNIEAYLGEIGRTWTDFPRVLDWGCGAGRLTRYLLTETGAEVTGADIDADNIAWCRNALLGGRFEIVPLRPPTAFADSSFDLVVGLSVMTHLQEPDQFLWLAELERITRPDGLVFLSVQGPTQFAYNKFPPKLYRQVQAQGFLDLHRDPALDGVVSDTEYYRAAMHSRSYIVEKWGKYFDIIGIEDAIAAMQDFVVMRRR